MAWLNWFSRSPSKAMPAGREGAAAAAKVATAARGHDVQQPAVVAASQRLEQRRNERNAKRELLFQVVRESMVRVGVLSSAFRFKVLSLDQRGRGFLVMMELSAEFSGEAEKLAEIESLIAQSAKHRHDITVQAVYWRYFNSSSNQSTPASAPSPLLGAGHAPMSRPAPIPQLDSRHKNASGDMQRAPLASAAGAMMPMPPVAPVQKHDELTDDEVAAFRRALVAGAAQGAMAATEPIAKPPATQSLPAQRQDDALETARNKLLLTGYEDTEMVDDDPMPALSGTQYGELR